ncbi:dienelactone hydrolase family protein [Murimonas intestini]|uniref:Alpha/beta hydrolase family protein n=1 Tax=Murimonas intestini TaxID=1337051 RepID=A0AB73SY97_9FIRM|nr:alpha/beta hydrolase family protein [Murimonas intestini]MCR1842242.1 alpha/beta hydrolase family protein [Murimonas intestini]MCR1868324.1 alpha/beta hydrolase family protein [Murimonas intestini]MCR1885768.1 alpha/beta hydrolase family protein [Murimonas intestini]
MKYYTAQEHFERIFANTKRTHEFIASDTAEFGAWSESLRLKLNELMGTDQMTLCPPRPRVAEEIACDGYVRKKILIDTEEDITMPFYMLIPSGVYKGEKRTALIACHGHSSCGKEAVAGVREKTAVAGTIEDYNYNYGEEFARRGYIVFAPDARGFGERREKYDQGDEPEKLLSSSCAYLNVMAMSLGQTVIGMWVWDLMRLADFALSCECVNGHVVCAGLSGGGMQSLMLAAMDVRIECCIISGYFYGYLQSLLINYNCHCNYVPNLWKTADIGDIGALISPRPVLIETGNKDSLNGQDGLGNVLPQIEKVRKAMKLFGKEDNLYHDIFEGEHKWHGDKAYQWMISHMPPKMEEGK